MKLSLLTTALSATSAVSALSTGTPAAEKISVASGQSKPGEAKFSSQLEPPTEPECTWCSIRTTCQETMVSGWGPKFCVLDQLPREFDYQSAKQDTCDKPNDVWNGILATCKKGFEVGVMPTWCMYNTLPPGLSYRSKDPGFVLPPGYTFKDGLTYEDGWTFDGPW